MPEKPTPQTSAAPPPKELVASAPSHETVPAIVAVASPTITTVAVVSPTVEDRNVAAWLLGYYALLLAALGGAALWGVRQGWSSGVTPPSSDPLGVVDTRGLLGEVLLIAMLGGWLHGVSSLAMHTARRSFISSWWLFYVTRPLVGSVTGLFMYLVLSGGVAGFVVAPGRQGVDALLAWSALAGLFSTVATQKLKDVLNALFRPNMTGPEDTSVSRSEGWRTTSPLPSAQRPEVQAPNRGVAPPPPPRSPSV